MDMPSTISSAGINEILRHIPHRYPFLLIDRVDGYEPNKWVRVIKNVSYGDWFLRGLSPGHVIMPQLLVVEALAQAAGVLCHFSGMSSRIGKSIIFFAGIENCLYGRDVGAGDKLVLYCELKRSLRGVAKLHAEASTGGEVVAVGDLTAVIRDVE